jgi:hypothetical protein
MQAIDSHTPTVRRDRQLYRLIDLQASDAAEAALRRTARANVSSPDCLPAVPGWIRELREVASLFPDSGACTVATALKVWLWTASSLGTEHGDEMADILTPLLAARALVLEVVNEKSQLRTDLSNVYAAQASAQAGAKCAELVYGYRNHLKWDAEGCATCYVADDLDELEAFMPGIAAGAGTTIDVLGADGSHPAKRGPCANASGIEAFVKLRNRLDACLTGARIAKDRVAAAIAKESAS